MSIPDGSTITTSVFVVEPLCGHVGPAKPITITFGVAYVGDLGSGLPLCIARSKATFSQFTSTDPLVTIFQDKLKEMIFVEMDKAVVATLTSAPPPTPRCPSWRQLP